MKCLCDVVVGDTVFRWFPEISLPMELTVTAVTSNRIMCGDWEFDLLTGAEIDEFLGWGRQDPEPILVPRQFDQNSTEQT